MLVLTQDAPSGRVPQACDYKHAVRLGKECGDSGPSHLEDEVILRWLGLECSDSPKGGIHSFIALNRIHPVVLPARQAFDFWELQVVEEGFMDDMRAFLVRPCAVGREPTRMYDNDLQHVCA